MGIRDNLSLESLTINAPSGAAGMIEPFRLFTAAESSLVQDYNEDPAQPLNTRFLHYLIGQNQSTLIAEHLYPLDLEPPGTLLNGLSELLVIDQGGHFLALERALWPARLSGAPLPTGHGGRDGYLHYPQPERKSRGSCPSFANGWLLDFVDTGIEVDNTGRHDPRPPVARWQSEPDFSE